MKLCYTCRKKKDLSEFNLNRSRADGYNSICRRCSNASSRRYYGENTEKHKKVVKARRKRVLIEAQRWVCEYLYSHPCVDCGETDILVLDFDHRRRSRKENKVAEALGDGWSLERIKKEVAKCDIRCANCHRRKTARQVGNYKLKYATGA